MATYDEIKSLVLGSVIEGEIRDDAVDGMCGFYSGRFSELLGKHGISHFMLGSEMHWFLLVESEDQGVILIDRTAQQFRYSGGPQERILLPVDEAINIINSTDITQYWKPEKIVHWDGNAACYRPAANGHENVVENFVALLDVGTTQENKAQKNDEELMNSITGHSEEDQDRRLF